MEEITLSPNPEAEEPQEAVFATVAAVYSDGLSLLFDGAEEPSQKHYLCNKTVFFSSGDRVKLCRDSGTIVVEYPIGSPKSAETHGIPAGGTAGQLLTKVNATDYNASWQNAPKELPAGGDKAAALVKKSASDSDVEWSRIDGVQNQYMPSSSTYGGPAYDIQFKTTTVGGNPTFQIRMGPTGTWKTITVT